MRNDFNIKILLKNKESLKEFVQQISNARETKNVTQEQAAKLLNINKNILVNLENGELKNLENDVFTLGHIKTYLKWLDINHDNLFERISPNNSSAKVNEKTNFTIIDNLLFILRNKYGKRKLLFTTIFLSVLSSTIIIFSWNLINEKKYNNIKKDDNISNIYESKELDEDNNLKNEDDNVINANINHTIISEEIKKKELNVNNNDITYFKIVAKDDSWIEIQDKNSKTVISKILKKNDSLIIDYEKGLSLVTGNAGGINIEIKDIVIENIGKDGEVKRDISLNYNSLIKFNE